MKKIIYIITFLALTITCKEGEKETILLKKEIFTKGYGNMDDNLENGRWSYRNNGKLSKEGRYDKGYKIGDWSYYNKNGKQIVKWKIFKNKVIKINYPKRWNIKEKKKYLFYALSDIKKKDFFLLLQYNKETYNIVLLDYVEQMFLELQEKQIQETITKYSLKKMIFKEKTSYFLILNTIINQTKYTYFSFYTEDNDYVYDFTYKFEGEDSFMNNEIFSGVIYSISIYDEKLFYNKDKLIKVENIRVDEIDSIINTTVK